MWLGGEGLTVNRVSWICISFICCNYAAILHGHKHRRGNCKNMLNNLNRKLGETLFKNICEWAHIWVIEHWQWVCSSVILQYSCNILCETNGYSKDLVWSWSQVTWEEPCHLDVHKLLPTSLGTTGLLLHWLTAIYGMETPLILSPLQTALYNKRRLSPVITRLLVCLLLTSNLNCI